MFSTPVNFDSGSPELVALCGENSACLVDGLVGTIDDALSSLQAQAEVDASKTAALKFFPAAVLVNTAVNVLITRNTSEIVTTLPDGLIRFTLYRVDPIIGNAGATPIISLEDNGESGFSDTVKGDGLFSNLLVIKSAMTGEVFGFRAVALVSRTKVETSPLAITVPVAVRSHSKQSGIGNVAAPEATSVSLPNMLFENSELVLRYSYGADQIALLSTSAHF
ncbi:hypothetical protein FGB62_75g022 [Gracilaria domingensis]|nr:hypothetical protein FGB62_75g022 [Gracilaria domingensis]